MKKLLIFLLLLAGMFIFPLRLLSLPDEWTLYVKDNARDYIDGQQNDSAVTQEVPTSYINDIKLGMSKERVDQLLGKPKDQLINQYNDMWYVYHHQYRNFILVDYIESTVNGIYIVASPFHSIENVKYGMTKSQVQQQLGEPLEIFSGPAYHLRIDEPHALFYLIDGIYYTYYFDQHEDHQLVGMKVVTEALENKKTRLYANPSNELKTAYETLDYYLINADRVKHGLPPLRYHDKISNTALKHSQDMADHDFFNHINLEGLDPFDRMQRDALHYRLAGENLAYGQISPIEAHHGLMNSLGHRKNILNKDFEQVGIGVAFNPENIPYYTENYITEN